MIDSSNSPAVLVAWPLAQEKQRSLDWKEGKSGWKGSGQPLAIHLNNVSAQVNWP